MKRGTLILGIVWAVLLAALVGITLAARGEVVAQHGGDVSTNSEQEHCRNECHTKHCDAWVLCNNRFPDASSTERDSCKKRVEEDETRCQKLCELPKT